MAHRLQFKEKGGAVKRTVPTQVPVISAGYPSSCRERGRRMARLPGGLLIGDRWKQKVEGLAGLRYGNWSSSASSDHVPKCTKVADDAQSCVASCGRAVVNTSWCQNRPGPAGCKDASPALIVVPEHSSSCLKRRYAVHRGLEDFRLLLRAVDRYRPSLRCPTFR